MPPVNFESDRCYKLPPLILHPFSDSAGPGKLVESSRASLMIQGLLPRQEFTIEELDTRLLNGRYCEIRMLFYVGRDLVRWIEQCQDYIEREKDLNSQDVVFQSFAGLLVEDPPENVKQKLSKWGVVDHRSIFSRAIGLNMVFADAPAREALSDAFIRSYYRFADHMYACNQNMHPYAAIHSRNFDFDLFASGEYSRMLEREWQES
jgi:hypothetical protein